LEVETENTGHLKTILRVSDTTANAINIVHAVPLQLFNFHHDLDGSELSIRVSRVGWSQEKDIESRMVIKIVTALLMLLAQSSFAQLTVVSGSTYALAGSQSSMACTNVSVQGTLNVGSTDLSQVASIDISSGGQVLAGSSTISLGRNWSNNGTYTAGTGTVLINDVCSSGPSEISGSTQFNNLTLSSSTGRSFILSDGAVITISGTLRLEGTQANPITLSTRTGQSAKIQLMPGAQIINSNGSAATSVSIVQVAQPIPTLDQWMMILLSVFMTIAIGFKTSGLKNEK
jgi:hypothetical protein